jgi:hypothetical protein
MSPIDAATDTDDTTERTLVDVWTEITWGDVPPIEADPDEEYCHADSLLRAGRTASGFLVATFATGWADNRGQTGIAVAIWAPGRTDEGTVYFTGLDRGGLVYGAPGQSDDSDSSLLSDIILCCHAAQHDDDDNTVDPGWDAKALYDDATMAESWLRGEE